MLRAAVALLVVLAASSISCAHATAEPNDCDEGRVVQTTDGCVCRAGDSDVTCSQGEVCTSDDGDSVCLTGDGSNDAEPIIPDCNAGEIAGESGCYCVAGGDTSPTTPRCSEGQQCQAEGTNSVCWTLPDDCREGHVVTEQQGCICNAGGGESSESPTCSPGTVCTDDGGTSACADPEESDSGTGAPQRCFGVCNRDETEDVAVAIEVSGLTLEDAVLAKHDVLVALLASEYAMEIGTDGEGSASGAAATDGVPATDFSASISVSEGMTESSVVITVLLHVCGCDVDAIEYDLGDEAFRAAVENIIATATGSEVAVTSMRALDISSASRAGSAGIMTVALAVAVAVLQRR